jgi:hypothetical protein
MARAAKPKPKPAAAGDAPAVDKDELLALYRSMLLIPASRSGRGSSTAWG